MVEDFPSDPRWRRALAFLRYCRWRRPAATLVRGWFARGNPASDTQHTGGNIMVDTLTDFSHIRPGDTEFRSGGLRDFFTYRDLGIAKATKGAVIAQLVRAQNAPEDGTGWHVHEAQFHIVYMLKGWARFMYEDKETLVSAGDCVHQNPGIRHYLFDYSPDMEYLEVVGPADFGSIGVDGPQGVRVPAPQPWNTADIAA
jgi:quercetin dioxygenase-like cupin family protein